jgi:hypothetical protein
LGLRFRYAPVRLDRGRADAGWADAGWADAGWADAGWADAGWADAGWTDAGWADAGWTDAGWADAGWADAGWADAGWTDAGWADAGWADAGWADAGSTVGDFAAGNCTGDCGRCDSGLRLATGGRWRAGAGVFWQSDLWLLCFGLRLRYHFSACASLYVASPALSQVIAPLSAALDCTNWRRLGVRRCACRLFSGASLALGDEPFTGHGHVVLSCLVFRFGCVAHARIYFSERFCLPRWLCWRLALCCRLLCFVRLTALPPLGFCSL